MGLKIGVPKIRLSRKLVFITLGITVLLGGTGAAALYMGGADLLGEPKQPVTGGVCTDIQTMVLKTPSNHLWLRKYIRMEAATGPERVRTALRIAGLLAKTNAVDLIHVSVLDAHGPEKRAGMRGRAIGAEVLIALKPGNLPEMKTPAMASYYEGPVSDEGRFYGDKVVIDFDEVRSMMSAMRSVEEKPDCTKPELPEDEAAKAKDHAKPKKDKSADHGEKPANDHGEQTKSEEHGKEPAKDGEKAQEHGEQPAKEQSFMDSMLGMVGLGGSEEKPAEEHGDQTKAEGHDKQPASDHGEQTKSEEHGEKPAKEGETAEAPVEQPAKEQSFLDGMLGMVGLGGSEEKPAEEHGDQTKAEGHDKQPAKEDTSHAVAEEAIEPAPDEHGEKPVVTEEHAPPAESDAEATSHEPAKAEDHSEEAKPAAEKHVEAEPTSHDAKPAEEASDEHAKPAEADGNAHEPAKAEDHSEITKPANEKHVEAEPASHDAKPAEKASDQHAKPADAEANAHEPAKAEDHSEEPKPADEKHVEAEPTSHDAKPAEGAVH